MTHGKYVAAIVAAVGIFAGGATAAPAAFTDPAGDNGPAADVTNVAVSDGGGSVTIVVTASALTAGQDIDIYLNTDKNDSTGSPTGSEFNVEVWQEADDWGWDMATWSGSEWKETPQNPDEHFSRSGNVFTWTIPTSELGGTTGFTFWTGSFMFSGDTMTGMDRAPDGGTWVYDLAAKPAVVVPTIGKAFAVPAAPRAGQLLSLSVPVTKGATVAVAATIAGKAVPRTVAFSNGTAQIAVAVPKNAKGKILQVKVTATLGAQRATRTVTYKIK